MAWTHPICDDCYQKKQPGRQPYRLTNAGLETCCFCSEITRGGIYIRFDPTNLKCHHD